MNLEKIYEYRFKGIEQGARVAAWQYISAWIMKQLEYPEKILEIGAGRCEFINQCNAKERWALDIDANNKKYAEKGVNFLIGKLQDIEIESQFDAVFMSNFLEHLNSPNEVDAVLKKSFSLLRGGVGKIAILGPNFKYAYLEYFDCADHILPLTHISVSEYLIGAGFENIKIFPKVLPFSFRSSLPTHPVLVKWYLSFPFAWKILGKQFFIIGEKI